MHVSRKPGRTLRTPARQAFGRQILHARDFWNETRTTDVVVIGSGVAGLSAALAMAPRSVTLLTKTELVRGSASEWAQGGVAAALGAGDSPRLHALDTLEAGAGLCDPNAVEVLTTAGPGAIRELIERGARFDRDERGDLLLGREGAHRRRRILHAGGDATGAEMVRALAEAVRQAPHIQIGERAFVTDLVLDDNGIVVGVLVDGVFLRSAAVVLATGGCGQLYERTTNPRAATGDGLAMAARAGAQLADLEMIQFHPTALDIDRDPRPLVTEALRGEGAWLFNDLDERFMEAVDSRLELAPRDIVSRAIWRQQQAGRRVLLDATECLGAKFPDRFPTVFASCQAAGIDPRVERIPVTPAAHYAMAGVVTNTHGRTSLDGLWACGEVTSTGVHGANRLASNSLLEGLVFGARVAEDLQGRSSLRSFDDSGVVLRFRSERPSDSSDEKDDGPTVRARLRRLMWDRAALVRDRAGLNAALAELDRLETDRLKTQQPSADIANGELDNLLLLGRLVCLAAQAREESIGAHFRADFPEAGDDSTRHVWTLEDDGSLASAIDEIRPIAAYA